MLHIRFVCRKSLKICWFSNALFCMDSECSQWQYSFLIIAKILKNYLLLNKARIGP